jgi:hypothetical protein
MCDVRGWMPAARPCHRRHLGRRRVAQGYFSATILEHKGFDGLTLSNPRECANISRSPLQAKPPAATFGDHSA